MTFAQVILNAFEQLEYDVETLTVLKNVIAGRGDYPAKVLDERDVAQARLDRLEDWCAERGAR